MVEPWAASSFLSESRKVQTSAVKSPYGVYISQALTPELSAKPPANKTRPSESKVVVPWT